MRQVAGKGAAWHGRMMAVVCLLAFFLSGMPQAATVQVVGSTGTGGDAFLSALSRELGEGHAVTAAGTTGQPDIVIALHEGALPEARRVGGALLVIVAEAGRVELPATEGALYWAPSWTDQLRLAHRIFPSLRRVGLLLDDNRQQARVRSLKDQARQLGLELVVKETDQDQLVKSVAELAGASDVIIAPADSRLFSRHTLKPVLLAAYRQNRVFIGPTAAVVRAGALATLHVTPEILAAEVADRIRRQLKDGSWGAASRVTRFEVATNPQVARSLGLRLPDQEQLTRQWLTEGSTPWP